MTSLCPRVDTCAGNTLLLNDDGSVSLVEAWRTAVPRSGLDTSLGNSKPRQLLSDGALRATFRPVLGAV